MKKSKLFVTTVFMIASAVSSLFAVNIPTSLTSDIHKDISGGLDGFTEDLMSTVTNATLLENVYADAYIGKLFPSLKPHFAVGLNFGVAKLNMSDLNDASSGLSAGLSGLGISGIDFTIPDTFVMPVASIDVRVGGLFLPFDLGFSFITTSSGAMKIDTDDYSSYKDLSGLSISSSGFSGSYDYFSFGVDMRYDILEDGILLPGVSVGLGYYISKGAFGVSAKSDGIESNVDVAYSSNMFVFETQISKKLLFITPFAGLKAVATNAHSSWGWNFHGEKTVTYSGASIPVTYSDSDSGTSSRSFYVTPNLYAGVGFNYLFVLQTTLSASYDLRNSLWGACLNMRVRL